MAQGVIEDQEQLLTDRDIVPVSVFNEESTAPFFMICDHAGYVVPEQLQELGIEAKDRYRHIAWDIGIKEVGKKLAILLNSTLVIQNYSRLVIDCNRHIDHPTSIATISDQVIIPGNQNLTLSQRKQRINEIYLPYHHLIDERLSLRKKQQQETCLISLHSFTPEMQGQQRKWHAGVLHNKNNDFSLAFKKILEEHYPYPIGDNEPYALTEQSDYSVPFHAFQANLPYLELEIRQDLITTEVQQQEWAERLSVLLPLTLKEHKRK